MDFNNMIALDEFELELVNGGGVREITQGVFGGAAGYVTGKALGGEVYDTVIDIFN